MPDTTAQPIEHPTYRVCLVGIARNLNRRGMDRVTPAQAPQLPLFESHR